MLYDFQPVKTVLSIYFRVVYAIEIESESKIALQIYMQGLFLCAAFLTVFETHIRLYVHLFFFVTRLQNVTSGPTHVC